MKLWPWHTMLLAVSIGMALPTADSAETKLIFRAQGATIPAGKSIDLGKVEVASYSAIRVVASTRLDSDVNATIQLILMEGDEQYLATLDIIILTPKSTTTRVYQVPGRKLLVQAATVGSSGSTSIDVIMYGIQ